MTSVAAWVGPAGPGGMSLQRHVEAWRRLPAEQQPDWEDADLLRRVSDELAELRPLVAADEIDTLRSLLAEVAVGAAQVIQAGDCAEDPAESTSGHIARKTGLLDALAGAMKMRSHKPVVRVGRIGGQFAKPRSKATECVGGVEIPVYRGHMVNSPQPDPEQRRPDPKRLLLGYWAASTVLDILRPRHGMGTSWVEAPVWTSHEALLLDYEVPMVRQTPDGRLMLSSTHWPWIGDRTRQVDGAHVALLAAVSNPVACKVGPSMSVGELLELCERLDPAREPGRLTLIARMGADRVADKLPALVEAVHAGGWPVIWLCDPMHGNTISASNGRKTRLVPTVIREIEAFHAVLTEAGVLAGGLHLEVTPDQVVECLEENQLGATELYTSFCDPRLNPQQAVAVVSAWRG